MEFILTKVERKEKKNKKRTEENTAIINNAKKDKILHKQKGKYHKKERKKSIITVRPLQRM